MRVLIVDDEPHIQKIIDAFLRRYAQKHSKRLHIDACDKPEQALFELTTHGEDYDLMILDVRMPTVSGLDMYHALKETYPNILSRILFITGYPEDINALKASILCKPFRYTDLETNIQHIEHSHKFALAA
jgi:CheY-like chemotaxis protein